MITMLFTVGSLEDAINASSPFQNSFTNTGSTGVNVTLTLILALLIVTGNITSLATTSREVWAFARDGGTPGHRWISKVSQIGITRLLRAHQSILTGAPPPKRPLQRRTHHKLPILHPLPNPARQHRRLQHHNLPQPHRFPRHLRHLHRLSPAQALPTRTLTTRTLQPWSLGVAHQPVRVLLLGAYACVQLLPGQCPGRCEYGELGPGHLGRRAGYCVGVIPGAGEKGLQGSGCVCGGGQERRNGIADGLKCHTRPRSRRQSVYEKMAVRIYISMTK